MAGGSLRLLAPSTLTAGSSPQTALAAALTGTGNVRIDPQVVLNTGVAPPIASTLAVQTLSMPSVLSTSAAPGGTIGASALGPVGDLVVLLVSFPGPASTVPGISDPFWLAPGLTVSIAVDTPQPGVPIAGSVAVPAVPLFLGVRLGWQSASFGALGPPQASNPSWSLVR